MLTAIRKLFGLLALIWLGWVALTLVIFGITTATGMTERSRGDPAASPPGQSTKSQQHGSQKKPPASLATHAPAELAAGMFLISYLTATPGILSCIIWFGLKSVQASGRRKRKRPAFRAGHVGTRHYLDFGRWFELSDGQAVFTQGKHAGRLLWEVARKNPEYLRWMLGEELANDTRKIVADALDRELRPDERRAVARPDDRTPTPALAAEPSPPSQSPEVFTYEAPGQPLCPQCGLRPGLFYCLSHRALLCLNCMGSHDVPAECSYVPGWRAEVALTGHSQPAGAAYSYEAPGLPRCPQCHRRPALLYCGAHRLSLCMNCVGSHDVPSECSYVPGWRAEKSGAKDAPAGGSGSTHHKHKTGDVFGIS